MQYAPRLMRRPRATGVGALIVALATVLLPPTIPAVDAVASSCTGWTSTVVPPPTINVLRTSLGRVQTVPFRRYVEYVLAAEWGPSTPREALAAGAVAIEQYGWYFTLAGHWRGGRAGGTCFDVRDTNVDQVYRPGSKVPTAGQRAAVSEVWGTSVRKPDGAAPGGRFFMTSYNGGGAYRRCGSGLTGWKLWQDGASNCAKQGMSFGSILSLYYGPGLRIVNGPSHNLDSTVYGDVGLLVDRESPGTRSAEALLLSSDGTKLTLRSDQPLGFSLADSLGWVTADLTGDGRADLAVLLDAGDGLQVRVFPGTGSGFGPGTVWWNAGPTPALDPAQPLQLIAADWNGDRRADLGLVGTPTGTSGTVAVLRLGSTGSTLASAGIGWQAPLAGTLWRAYGGDFTGDGRTDVALLLDLGGTLALDLVPSGSGIGTLAPLAEWGRLAQFATATTLPLLADVNGDGRMDLVFVSPLAQSGLTIALESSTGRGFRGSTIATFADGYPWPTVRAGAADLNGDGRDDLYLLSPDGDGARIEALLSQGSTVATQTWADHLDIDPTGATTF